MALETTSSDLVGEGGNTNRDSNSSPCVVRMDMAEHSVCSQEAIPSYNNGNNHPQRALHKEREGRPTSQLNIKKISSTKKACKDLKFELAVGLLKKATVLQQEETGLMRHIMQQDMQRWKLLMFFLNSGGGLDFHLQSKKSSKASQVMGYSSFSLDLRALVLPVESSCGFAQLEFPQGA
ncbi:hypothetical protein NL676_010799 [Syzygium grande]|nr:hypothetical protein NL676_010799 [Syzygium grande]